MRGADSEELQIAISDHLETTKGHVERLERIFDAVQQKAKAKHCKGMEGLLREGTECLKEKDKGLLRDLQLGGAAQRVEHYEMAAYGTVRAIAAQLGLKDATKLLNETLKEEAAADRKLTEVADSLYRQGAGSR